MRRWLFVVAVCGLGACGDDEPGSLMDGGTNGDSDSDSGKPSSGDDEADGGVFDPMCTGSKLACNGVCLSDVGDAKDGCSVFAGEFEIDSMRAAGADLLYSAGGSLFVYETASGNRRTLSDLGGQHVTALARDNDQVFVCVGEGGFGELGKYLKVAYAGGTAEVIPVGEDGGVSLPPMKQLEVVGDTIYGLPNSILDQSVFTLPKAGGVLDETVEVATQNFAIDETALYTASGIFEMDVRRNPLPGIYAGGTTLATLDNIEFLAVDATHIYWARTEFNDRGWAIERMAKQGGGSVETIATGKKSYVMSMVVSDGYVYYAPRWNAVLKRVPVTGGAPETLAEVGGEGSIQNLVVAGQKVFMDVSNGVLQVDL